MDLCFVNLIIGDFCVMYYENFCDLKMTILFENLRCYKLVSKPWFEGFGCTFGYVWTQTRDLRKNFKRNDFSKAG